MTAFATLEVAVGETALALSEFEADFGEAQGGEVLVEREGGAVTLHILGRREIGDGALSCAVDGRRRGRVTLDVAFLLRIAEEVRRGVPEGE